MIGCRHGLIRDAGVLSVYVATTVDGASTVTGNWELGTVERVWQLGAAVSNPWPSWETMDLQLAPTAGTCIGSVDLLHMSALEVHGPIHPYQSLQSSGGVRSLAALDDKGLAVCTCTGSVDLFHMSALEVPAQTSLSELAVKWWGPILGRLG